MSKKHFIFVLCCLALVFSACSADNTNADTPEDAGVTDVASDVDEDAADGDVTEDVYLDIKEPDVISKVANGESCPPGCQPLGDFGYSVAICDGCEDGYCAFPEFTIVGQYCTKMCNNQAACDSLGEGWTCDTPMSGVCNPPN